VRPSLPASSTSAAFWTPPRTTLAVVAWVVLHVSLAVSSLVRENPTIDEVIHLPAGISYWQTGTFKLYRHNPPLVKLVAALPVIASGVVTDPLYRMTYWNTDPPNKTGFAHEFARLNAADYFELFTRARLLMPLFSILGGLAVFAWSRRLYGTGGGLLSLGLWSLCPNILAHARLVTTDVGASSIGVGATFLFWLYLKDPSWRRAIVAGLALGIAQLTKFSLLLLYGVWPLIGLARFAIDRQPPARGRTIGQGAAMVLVSLLVLNLGYGFEGFGRSLGAFRFLSTPLAIDRAEPIPGIPARWEDQADMVARVRVNRFRGTLLGGLPVPLPAQYLLGFDDQKLEADGLPVRAFNPGAPADALQGYPVYLDGELSDRSWWDYYFRAMAYKVPEGTWLLVVGSLVVLVASPRARASWGDELAVLIPPVAFLVAMTVLTNINLGLRYVLPVFPYLFVSAGKLVPWACGLGGRLRWAGRGLVGAGLLLTALATASIHPHYLAYFNTLSGGPANGSRHLIDSNLDWGQDLVGLWRWLKANAPGERVGIAYFGQVPPIIFTARGDPLDWYLPPARPGTWGRNIPPRYRLEGNAWPPQPGLYAVSASLMRGLKWRVYDSYGADVSSRLVWAPYDAEKNAFSYFADLTPVADIGYSILLYRLTPEESAELGRRWAGGGR
jgi:hypothetical protein